MKKYIHGRRALLFKLFTVLSLTSINNLALANTEQFEQAYAPVMVGDITTFIPIELTPDAVVRVSSKQVGDQTQLAWTPSSNAEYYKVLKYNGSSWVTVMPKVTNSFYTYNGTGQFRVVACFKYGCQTSTATSVHEKNELSISAFYTQTNAQISENSQVTVAWQLAGSTSATVTHIQNGRATTKPITALQSGSTSFYVQSDSKFRLTASGFNGETTSTEIHVATQRANPFLDKGLKSEYKQPLYNLGLDIIQRTILQTDHHLVFATHDSKLFFYRAYREQGQPVSWQQEWQLTLDGVVNSIPNLTENYLYFSETNASNQGRLCKARLTDKQNLICSDYYAEPLLTSPIIVNNDGDYSAKFVDSISPTSKAGGVYAFYHNGDVRIFDQQTLVPKPQSFSLSNDLEQPMINTPTVFLNKKRIQGISPQFLIKERDNVMGVGIPSNQAVQQAQSFGVLAYGQQATPKPMTVIWKGKL